MCNEKQFNEERIRNVCKKIHHYLKNTVNLQPALVQIEPLCYTTLFIQLSQTDV